MAWSIVSPTGTSATINSSGKLTSPANTGETDITWVVKYTYNDGVQNRETTKILTQGQNSSSCSIVVESYDILKSVTVLDNPPSYTFTGNTIEFATDTYCRCAFAVFSTNGEVGSNLYLDSSENVGEVWIRDCEIVFGAIIGNHKSGSDIGRIVVHNDCGESAVFTVKYFNEYTEFDEVAYLGGCCATGDCVNDMPSVDLCLPSGNWWSTHDLWSNHSTIEGNNVYCSWGNQEFRRSTSEAPFSQANYNGTSGQTKYNGGTSISQGSSDDVVRTSIGCRWVLPTPDDWQELFDNCTVASNGANFRLTSKINGSEIFFSDYGYYIDYEMQWGKNGYWTTERATNGAKMAIINSPDASCDDCQNVLTIESKEPYYGARLRGILKKP